METPQPDPLVRRIRQGDEEALAEYLRNQESRLLGFLRAITSPRLLAVVELDDLYQDVCTAALTGLDTAPLDRYEPIEWLQQVARRRVVDAHRFHFEAKRRDAGRRRSIHGGGQDNPSAAGLEGLLAASMTTPSEALSRDIRLQRVDQAIAELGEPQRTVIRMRYGEGLGTKQIAEQLGKTDVSIRVLLSRCVRQLEQRLGDVKPSPR